ncbi:hypothetical protein KDA_61900 [Dictyobacter alpinus]|uniref:Uncharacterized protein n=1 Tax=Dictyobacter alpinus TaxID=2014873 RepID=A0A402BH89_9CHLR|nr:hypothetical protein KDA_61900 [Dictyobacter alpinus]
MKCTYLRAGSSTTKAESSSPERAEGIVVEIKVIICTSFECIIWEECIIK